jgi:hypothetical protein
VPLEIMHRAAPCRWVRLTFTLAIMRFIAGLIAGPIVFYCSLLMLPEGRAAVSLLYWLPYFASVALAVLIAGPWRVQVYENWLWAFVVTVLLVIVVFVFDLIAALAYGCSRGICL